MTVHTIPANWFHRRTLICDRIDLIDVRAPDDFREMHALCARNVPLDRFVPEKVMTTHDGNRNDPLYVICASDDRGKQACEKLIAAGYTDVVNVEGGMQAWHEAGLPVVRGKKAITSERKVKIAVGFMVLLGAILGFFTNPYFVGLSVFVGAGLMFVGFIGTYGMAMVLAKMPWNEVKDEDASRCPR